MGLNVNLFRLKRSDQGTQGILFTRNFSCYTLELPWRDNKPNISCIPAGEYDAKIRLSPKFGKVYWVMEVKGRSFILIRSGNWAGDVDKGFRTHVNGCILLGAKRGTLQGQIAVLNSRITVKRFIRTMGGDPFKFEIYESF